MKAILFLVIILFFISCEQQKVDSSKVGTQISNIKVDKNESESPKTLGEDKTIFVEDTVRFKINSLNNSQECYVGEFDAKDYDYEKGGMPSNRITIQFDSIIGDSLVYGRSIVAGNLRPFSGDCFFNSKLLAYVIDVNEPGDNKYDGSFSMVLKDSSLSGQWYSYNESLKVNQREFDLKKANFDYDPSLSIDLDWIPLYSHGKRKENKYTDEDTGEVEYLDDLVETLTEASSEINASVTKLSKEDIENLYKTDLEIIRNSIYARHGYSFKNRKIRNIFDSFVDWYIPFSIDVSNQLTELEKQNIALIKRYEKHAETYYDSFGR